MNNNIEFAVIGLILFNIFLWFRVQNLKEKIKDLEIVNEILAKKSIMLEKKQSQMRY